MDRVAIVTGGLTGIGLEIARALAAEGHRLAIGARRGGDESLHDMVHDRIGPDTFVAPLDVRKKGSVAAFCMAVRNRLSTPAILVNCAGVEHIHPICDHDPDEWQKVIDTNLTGPFLMTRACLPGMIEAGWGRIVNIASTAAHTAMPGHAAYCASKSGLLGLSRATALEGAPHGVTCTTVSPTWVETEMLREMTAKLAHEKGHSPAFEIAEIARANPQNRLVQPQEIGALVAFLCSEAAAGLTMEDIQVNAGAHW